MKTCPKCGSHKVIIFDSNNDLCEKCNRWFPAVKIEPDPNPLQKPFDKLEKQLKRSKIANKKLRTKLKELELRIQQ